MSYPFGVIHYGITQGVRVRRKVWERDVFVFMLPELRIACKGILNKFFSEGAELVYESHCAIHVGEGRCAVWTPTQEDLSACDWDFWEADKGAAYLDYMAKNGEAMVTDNFALKLIEGKMVGRAAWPPGAYVKRDNDRIYLHLSSGSVKRWHPTEDEVLATDWFCIDG